MRGPAAFLCVVLIAAAQMAAAPRARAVEGLYLTWGECVLGGAASHDLINSCAGNAGQSDLYCAFRMPAPADSVLGMELVVDVQHSEATLPDWWRFDNGGCRAGQLTASLDFTARTACTDFYLGNAAGGLQGYYVTQPNGGANQARIRVAASVLPSFGYAVLDTSSTYYAARIIITNALSAGGSACAGCATPACLVLNTITVKRQPGTEGGDQVLTTPGPANANWATWQTGTGANCAAVPARPVTWGRLKSLYR
jgi:hypothetical protein